MQRYYDKLIEAVRMLCNGNFNCLWVVGRTGIGKSYQVSKTLEECSADYIVFSGDVSDAYLHEFLFVNNGKIIVFRDMGKLLASRSRIDTLKTITDDGSARIVSRRTYARHNVPDEFEFNGKTIFELNSIPRRYKDDIEALMSRGLLVELSPSVQEIYEVMMEIAREGWQKEVTKYLRSKINIYGIIMFNLRVQAKCFKIYQSDRDRWRELVDMFITDITPISRKLLREVAGDSPIRRIEFVKHLMNKFGWSYATAERRIREWILLEEIYTNGLGRREMLSLRPFGS